MKPRRFSRIPPTRAEVKSSLALIPNKVNLEEVNTMTSPKNNKNSKPEMRSMTGNFVTFEAAGDCVEGYYQGYTYTTILQRGEEVSVPKFLIETDEGNKEFLGTSQITEVLTRVPAGTYVMVSYIESTKTRSGFNVKKFDIQVEAGVQMLPAVQDARSRQSLYSADGQQLAESPL